MYKTRWTLRPKSRNNEEFYGTVSFGASKVCLRKRQTNAWILLRNQKPAATILFQNIAGLFRHGLITFFIDKQPTAETKSSDLPTAPFETARRQFPWKIFREWRRIWTCLLIEKARSLLFLFEFLHGLTWIMLKIDSDRISESRMPLGLFMPTELILESFPLLLINYTR